MKYRPIEIKSRLFEKGHSILSIAKQFDCSAANIHQLFKHKAVKSGKPYLIRKYIADAIGEEYQDIWE